MVPANTRSAHDRLHGTQDTAHRAEARLDFHNISVEESTARRGACARIHVPTGRICTLPHQHPGSCHFVRPGEVEESLKQHGVGVS